MTTNQVIHCECVVCMTETFSFDLITQFNTQHFQIEIINTLKCPSD